MDHNYVIIPQKKGEKPILVKKDTDKQAIRMARKRFDKKVQVFHFTDFSQKETYKKIF